MLKRYIPFIALTSLLLINACNESEKPNNSIYTTNNQAGETSISSHAVINGTLDTDKIHNAVVSLYLDYAKQSICTGTLIHPQWVLTAAHCVAELDSYNHPYYSSYNQYLSIAFGNTPDELASHQYGIESIYFHENYNSDGINNDIALIKLNTWVPDYVAFPIPPLHPNDGITRDKIYNEGVPVTFVGFGLNENASTEYKLKYDSWLSSYCGASDGDNINGCYYGTANIDGCHPQNTNECIHGTYSVYIPFGTLYYEHNPGGTCNGDSGGPAFVRTKSFPGIAVAGITSYGDIACAKIGVHTAVQDFYDSFIMRYAPEVKDYHDTKYFNSINAANAGHCNDDHFAVCGLTGYDQGYVSCSINDDKSWRCGAYCGHNDPTCTERCSDGARVCDPDGTGMRTCVGGRWSDPELCDPATPFCNYNRCRTSEIDWCTFHWLEANIHNASATGYGRILIPAGKDSNLHQVYMACTSDLSKPISEWTKISAHKNDHCDNCGSNLEFIASGYNSKPGENYCTFVFEYSDQVLACRPIQDGDSEPIPVHAGDSLEEYNTRHFYQSED